MHADRNVTAWLMLAAGDDREHGGNDGYEDDPKSHYVWDETVPNHSKPKPGDVIALWDKRILLGVSVIEHIERMRVDKPLHRCPYCDKSGIKPRKTKSPLYKCYKCKKLFDSAITSTTTVTSYRTRHEAGWVDLNGQLTGSQLRELCTHPKSQLSLRQLDYPRFRNAISAIETGLRLSPMEAALENALGGHRKSLVRTRVGQGAFRNQLLNRYGAECAFTGPTPVEALEAAHLYSYAAKSVHHVEGGLLMRRDIHRLFDVGHLAVDPTGLVIDVGSSLQHYDDYAGLHGRPLKVTVSEQQRRWIERHWSMHRK